MTCLIFMKLIHDVKFMIDVFECYKMNWYDAWELGIGEDEVNMRFLKILLMTID